MIQRPTLEQFTDAEGYVDYYGFDMAEEQWRDQFPNLWERWCPEIRSSPVVESLMDPSLEDLFAKLLA